MKVKVNPDLCGTTGQCVLTLPGMFWQRDKDGIAEAHSGDVPEALREKVLLAASQCPVAAIEILDDERGRPPLIHEQVIDVQNKERPMGKFNGKTAVVTGAGAGIGKACAAAIAQEGARVVVADIDGDSAEICAESIRAAGGEAIALSVDISDERSVAALFAQTARHFSGVDLLVNNASAMNLTPRDLNILEVDLAIWDQIIATNLRGTLLCCRQAIPGMVARGGGAIINMTSCQGLSGDTALTAYSASKAGMNMLTTSLATQYGQNGIRCNAVAPGLIITERLAAKLNDTLRQHLMRHQLLPRTGLPEDVAALVVFLLSEDAAFITGQVIRIDGGMLSHVPTYADGGNIRRPAPASPDFDLPRS
ncbi:short-chain dehydrogenase [Lonsdalea britannica]|uniref:Short-chain dehydrogenase n=1 Tax=Lonsdalea britannica TaxID=1082704 RepID=A0AAD0SEJ2_9GAMM|nr:glucose 1-dehydrogenase [Lonsdalea britannica]AXW86459.1 short-chain dehydrogenase [Lonsdalea britannica]